METVREYRRGAWGVRIWREYDEDPWSANLGYWGAFTNEWSAGAMELPDRHPSGCAYFVPGEVHETNENRAEALRRMEDYIAGDWWYEGVGATVTFRGEKVAGDSVWGIESDAGSYFAEAGRECAREAIAWARNRINAMAARSRAVAALVRATRELLTNLYDAGESEHPETGEPLEDIASVERALQALGG